MFNTFLKKILGLCYYLPYALLIAPIVVYLYLMINGQYGLMIKGLPIFVSLIIVSLLLLKNKKVIFSGDEKLCRELILHDKYTTSRLSKIFGITFCTTFIWILITETRDLVFLLFIIVLYSLIVIQTFANDSGKRFTPLILLELMAVFALQVFSTLFTHAYYYGWTDVPVHLNWIQTIVVSGHVESILGQYTNYCLFHIDSVMASLLSGLDTYTTLYLTATPLIIVSTVFIYHIAKHFTKSSQLSLLASFFYVMIPVIIQYAVYPMPRMHSTVAFIIILYGMFRWGKEFKFSHLLLVLFVMLYMVLVHHAQLIPVALMMTGIFVLLLIYRYRITLLQKLTLGFFYLVSVIGLLVGPYGISWVSKYLNKIFQSDVSDGIVEDIVVESGSSSGSVFAQISAAESLDVWNQVLIGVGISAWFSLIATAMMLVFILFGVYYLLSPKMMNKKIAVFGMFGVVLTLIFSPYVMELVEMWLGTNLMLSRLRLVMSPVFAIIMAVGCLVIGNIIATRKSENYNSNIKGILVIIILCIALVTASPILGSCRDTTIFDGLVIADTNYFTETEYSSFTIISEHIPIGSTAYTDDPTERNFPYSKEFLRYNMPYISLKDGGDMLFVDDNSVRKTVEYIILRKDRFMKSGLRFIDKAGKSKMIYPTSENKHIITKNLYPSESLYTNGGVVIYNFL